MAELLTAYLQREASKPFSYQGSDCATLCLGWLDLVTGNDGLSSWIKKYNSEAECDDMVFNHGGKRDIASQFLKSTYGIVAASSREFGNIVLSDLGGYTVFGIRCSSGKIVMRWRRGLYSTARAKVVFEWGPVCP